MPEWLFEKKELLKTPSTRDGIDNDTECRYRKEGARLICDVGADLKLQHDTVATGCVYFHRFFMYHSFRDFSRYVAALGCLFLAGKVEETPKKCRDIIRAARLRLNDEQFAAFGEDPREEVMMIERVLLQTIKFDLQVDHPYQYLLKYAKILKGDPEKIQKMVQMAWTFINDSFCTTLCLLWEPEVLAVALIYLASRLTKFDIEDWQGRNSAKANGKWWDQFVDDMSMDLLEEICHQVLDLYSNTSTAKEKCQQQSMATKNQNNGTTVSSASTPSPGGTAAKTPNTPAPTTPNPVTAASGVSSTPNTPAKTFGHPSLSAPGTPAVVPSTPVAMHPLTMSVPPPQATMGQQPAYAYAVPMPATMQPMPGVPTVPAMQYPPGAPAQVYASYNYSAPLTVAGTMPHMPPPSYAIPAGYGPPPAPHYDYRTGAPVTQPTYGTPTSIPNTYNIPPPITHPPGMVHPPPYTAPPPHHHRLPPPPHGHRRM